MSKTFRVWKIDEPLFLPPRVQDFVAEGHLRASGLPTGSSPHLQPAFACSEPEPCSHPKRDSAGPMTTVGLRPPFRHRPGGSILTLAPWVNSSCRQRVNSGCRLTPSGQSWGTLPTQSCTTHCSHGSVRGPDRQLQPALRPGHCSVGRRELVWIDVTAQPTAEIAAVGQEHLGADELQTVMVAIRDQPAPVFSSRASDGRNL